MSKGDGRLFIQRFMQKPGQIGSVMPSSRFLAEKMVQNVPWDQVSAVAELGAGTGAITRAINNRLTSKTDVFIFEMDPDMRRRLELQHPGFHYHSDAAKLVKSMHRNGIESLDCIISGLPFFNFDQELRETIMDQAWHALKPGGLFIAFQYSLQMKKMLTQRFQLEHIDFVPLNVPPAFVYTCRKPRVDKEYDL